MAKKKNNRRINVLRLSIVFFLVAAFIMVGSGIGVGLAVMRNLPNWDPSDFSSAQSTFVYDIEGRDVTKLHAQENRIIIETIDEVPENIINAFLAIEDARFYDHFGLDLRALSRAVVANITKGFGSQGASTITQQLVKNAMLTHDKELERKIQEAILSIQVERRYTKDEILTHYLNWVYFGHGAYGIKAAAEVYFGKTIGELSLAESATLAGLVQRPNALSPYRNPEGATTRRNLVLSNMVKYEFITAQESAIAQKEELNLPGLKQEAYPFPYFIDYVIDQAEQILEEKGVERAQLRTGGLHVYTTLDRTVQLAAQKAFNNNDLFPAPGPNEESMVQGAIAIVDHRTGEVKALVGGRDHVTERGLNRATQGLRQPGSSFKPIAVYAPALELGYSPASIIDDVPVEYKYGNQVYAPSNLGGTYRGLISIREALQHSPNIPAVELLNTIGVGNGFDFAQRLGFNLPKEDRVLSMALGGLTHGVSPLEMAVAYSAFANQGVQVEPHVITKITDYQGNVIFEANPSKKVVMSQENAFLMTDMLRTVVESGTGTRAKLPNRPVAGKTGTTQLPDIPELRGISGSRDVWFVGYTPELTAAVWIGYDRTDRNHYLSRVYGSTHPAMVFKATMEEALRDVPASQFSRPNSIVSVAIDAKSGLLPSELTPEEYIVTELFSKNNAPTQLSSAWIKTEVCAITGELPSDYCPELISKVFLQRPKPFVPKEGDTRFPQDYNLEMPKTVCSIHGPDEYQIVNLCNHPDHEGTLVRAIIGSNDTGCPDEYIVNRAFSRGLEPRVSCDIPEHQLETQDPGNSSNNNGNNGIDSNMGSNGNSNSDQNLNDPNQPQENIASVSSIKGQVVLGEPGFNGPEAAVQLTWEHPRGANIEFQIYRSTEKDFTIGEQYRIAANSKITSNTYRDNNNLSLNQTYYYKIVAYNSISKQKSTASPELAITVNP
ncbi:MAG: penicillin-binding protein 1A [Bacillota bacterium]|nr:penicillin-binding protein 1A [Bacillota bacterium]